MASRCVVLRYLLLALSLFCAVAADAQPVALPPGVGPIPELRGEGKVGAFVSAKHIELYRPVLPSEVADIVARGDLTFEIAVQNRPAPFDSAAPKEKQLTFQVQNTGEVSPLPDAVFPPLFTASDISSSASNRIEQGYKILWNTTARAWSLGSWSENQKLTLFQEPRSEGRELDILQERIYPRALHLEVGSGKTLFREKISFRVPAALSGLAWLSFRLFGPEEDYLWIASPLTHAVRQVTGSNRSDDFFPGTVAPDDLFVWSGKEELVVPTHVARQPLLAAFISATPRFQAANGSSCRSVDFKQTGVALNRDTRRFPQHPAWVPTNIIMTPRNVWRIDIKTRDPFYLDAVQSLFVDEDTQLPLYKVTWAQDGKLRKVVVGIAGFIEGDSGLEPWIFGELVYAPAARNMVVLTAQQLTACSKPEAGVSVETYDPAALLEGVRARATPNPATAGGPSSREDDEGVLYSPD